jgi:hypothetical protein
MGWYEWLILQNLSMSLGIVIGFESLVNQSLVNQSLVNQIIEKTKQRKYLTRLDTD